IWGEAAGDASRPFAFYLIDPVSHVSQGLHGGLNAVAYLQNVPGDPQREIGIVGINAWALKGSEPKSLLPGLFRQIAEQLGRRILEEMRDCRLQPASRHGNLHESSNLIQL